MADGASPLTPPCARARRTGNLGSALVERLVERSDVQVVAVARRLPEPDARDERVEYRAADITTDDLDALVTGVDAVVHLAWAIQPMHDPHRTWQINTGGTARLLTALERAGTRVVVHASSIGAYPPAADDRRVDETTPPSGIGHVPYSVQKAYDEALLDAFELRTTCRVVRLRPALVLQRAAGAEYEGLFLGALGSRALGALRRLRAPLPLPRDLRFAVVAAHDVARAVELALDHPDAAGPFNLSSEPPVRAADLASTLGLRTVHVPWRLVRGVVRLGFALRVVPLSPAWVDMIRVSPLLDTGRALGALDWRPEVSARDALADAIGGVLDHDRGATPPLDG
ncbi:MAG: NAD-dependent epimerase/dehydratase family protein [Ilumatobacteraceae bacterium]